MPFLSLLPPFLADPRWLQWLDADGLHLNSEGHRQVYALVRQWPALLHWAGLEGHSLATPLA